MKIREVSLYFISISIPLTFLVQKGILKKKGKAMKPWDVPSTVTLFQKMSGEETVKMGDSLTRASLEILYSSIREKNPKIRGKKLIEEAQKILRSRRKSGL